ANVHAVPLFQEEAAYIRFGIIPWQAWVFFACHAVLFSLLVVTSLTDIDHLEIPLPVTLTGMVLGLACSALWPWPWPSEVRQAWPFLPAPGVGPRAGLEPWPVWNSVPAGLPVGGWQFGLATGLAGVLAGMVVVRAIAFLFRMGRGKEGLGIGDADLMMMVGSFLGWQIVVVAFFVSVFPALVFAVAHLLLRGDRPLPFGPSLAVATLITCPSFHCI